MIFPENISAYFQYWWTVHELGMNDNRLPGDFCSREWARRGGTRRRFLVLVKCNLKVVHLNIGLNGATKSEIWRKASSFESDIGFERSHTKRNFMVFGWIWLLFFCTKREFRTLCRDSNVRDSTSFSCKFIEQRNSQVIYLPFEFSAMLSLSHLNILYGTINGLFNPATSFQLIHYFSGLFDFPLFLQVANKANYCLGWKSINFRTFKFNLLINLGLDLNRSISRSRSRWIGILVRPFALLKTSKENMNWYQTFIFLGNIDSFQVLNHNDSPYNSAISDFHCCSIIFQREHYQHSVAETDWAII